jgi:hypothetical protein
LLRLSLLLFVQLPRLLLLLLKILLGLFLLLQLLGKFFLLLLLLAPCLLLLLFCFRDERSSFFSFLPRLLFSSLLVLPSSCLLGALCPAYGELHLILLLH